MISAKTIGDPYLYELDGQTEFDVRGFSGGIVLRKIKYLIMEITGTKLALCKPFEFNIHEEEIVASRIEKFKQDFEELTDGGSGSIELGGLHLVYMDGGDLGRE